MNSPNPSQNYRTRRRPPLAQNSAWAGSPGWDPAGVRGRRPASGAASGRVRPRSGIRVWQTSNISLGSGMVRRGVRPPSGRIRRGLGTRVLLTCPGPADPPYRGGSFATAAVGAVLEVDFRRLTLSYAYEKEKYVRYCRFS